MEQPRNLMRMVYDAKVIPLDALSPVDPAMRQILIRLGTHTLERIQNARMRDVEHVLETVFSDLPKFKFQPNGKRKSPDMLFGRSKVWMPSVEPCDIELWAKLNPPAEWMSSEVMVEFKSAANFFSKFQFNDSVPQGYIWYLFMSRKEKRYLLVKGDVLLSCMSQRRIESVYNEVIRLRKQEKVAYGRKYSVGCDTDGIPPASALYIATPRWNPSFTNFLRYSGGNGIFDMDCGTIWAPVV